MSNAPGRVTTSHGFAEREYQQDKPVDAHNGLMAGIISSKGSLTYPGRGMHWETIIAHEFKGLDNFWYRVELWRSRKAILSGHGDEISSINKIYAGIYRRERGNWIPFKGNQQCAMERDRLLKKI